MSARKRKPNKDSVAIVEQFAAEMAAKLEASGYTVDVQRYRRARRGGPVPSASWQVSDLTICSIHWRTVPFLRPRAARLRAASQRSQFASLYIREATPDYGQQSTSAAVLADLAANARGACRIFRTARERSN
jgi:hypothetical protein